MFEEEDRPEEQMALKTITQTSQLESKPGSVFKTDKYVRNNHNLRPESLGCIKTTTPPFGFEPMLE